MGSIGGIFEVNSADQIGQLVALRFKVNGGSQFTKFKSEGILGYGIPGARKETPQGELTINMATRAGMLKSRKQKHGDFIRGASSGIPEGVSDRGGFAHAVKMNQLRMVAKRSGFMTAGVEN